jgi:APA family basic amino acid/polyamine antiporter
MVANVRVKTSQDRLRWGTIGILAAATLGIVFMSPALAFYGNWGPVAGTVGQPAALVFLIGALVAAPTAISYAFVARRLPAAGAAYTWVGRLFSKHVGNWHGWIMASFYILVLFTPTTLFGLFFNAFLNDIGIHVGLTAFGTYVIGVLLVFAVGALFAYPGIRTSTRAATFFVAFEILVILALALTILFRHTGSLGLAPFNPSSGSISYKAIWIVLPIAFYSYVGFDVVATAAEETTLPRGSIPKATIAAMLIFTAFLIFVVYAFTYAVPAREISGLVSSGITPIIPIASRYWGGAKIIVTITGLTAGMGATLAIFVGTGRILFAMGREGALTVSMGRLHPKFRTPWAAMTFLLVVGLLYDVIVGKIIGPLNAYFWAGTAVAFFALITYILVNVASFVTYRRTPEFNMFWHGLIPALGVIFSVAVLYKSFFQALWSAGWVTIGRGIVVFAVGWALVAVVYAYFIRNRASVPRIEPLDAGDSATVGGEPDLLAGAQGVSE